MTDELDRSGIIFAEKLLAHFAANKVDEEVELLDNPTTDGIMVVEHTDIQSLDQKTQDKLHRLYGWERCDE